MHCTDGKGHKRVSVTTVNDKVIQEKSFTLFVDFQ